MKTRILAALTALFMVLGLGLLAASPASAHTAELTGEATCQEDGWTVTWTLQNDKGFGKAEVSVESGVAPEFDGATLRNNNSITTKVSHPFEDAEATLTVSVQWKDEFTKSTTASVSIPEGCLPPVTVESCASPLPITTITPTYYKAHADGAKYEDFELKNGGTAEFTEDGLDIQITEGGKVKGMLAATNTSLTDAGAQVLTVADGWVGTLPAYNITIHDDALTEAPRDPTLVRSGLDGDQWYSAYDLEDGGALDPDYKTVWEGTLDDVLALFPEAKVTSFGFTLGTGGTGHGVLTGLTFGCTQYTFGVDKVEPTPDPTPTTPPVVTPPAVKIAPTALANVVCTPEGPAAEVLLDNSDSTEPVLFEVVASNTDGIAASETVDAGASKTVNVALSEDAEVWVTVTADDQGILDVALTGNCEDATPAPTTTAPTPAAPSTPSVASGDTLPHTGANVGWTALVGLIALAVGIGASLLGRRRGQHS